jgi:DNA-binding NtrC family response regulator
MKELSSAVLQKLLNYGWPGNVRELEHVMERAVALSETRIECHDIALKDTIPVGTMQPLRKAKAQAINECEQQYVTTVLQRCGGNVSHAAKMAGKERRTFQRLIRKHNIKVVYRNLLAAD